jgi:hypothetical protein
MYRACQFLMESGRERPMIGDEPIYLVASERCTLQLA